MRIFAGVHTVSCNSGVIENVFFRAFGRYVFGILGNEANIIIYYYLVLVAFLLTPKYVTLNDFEWFEWPFYVICSLLRTATCYLFTVVCLLHV